MRATRLQVREASPDVLLADLDRDYGDLWEVGAGGGWWWAVDRSGGGVLEDRCPRRLRAALDESLPRLQRAGR